MNVDSHFAFSARPAMHRAARNGYMTHRSVSVGRFDGADALFVLLLLFSAIQFFKIGGAQLGQLMAVLLTPVLAARGRLRVSAWEVWAFALFVGVSLSITFLSGYPHYKAPDQMAKFIVVMPSFYLLGRYFGTRAQTRRLPFGYVAIVGFLLFEYALQRFNVPLLYEKVDFMQSAVHGSFKERNWFAAFFFFTSYLCFLQSPRRMPDIARFMALALVVTFLSESKTVLIACGIVLLMQVRGYVLPKIFTMLAGAAMYAVMFTRDLSGDQLQVRLQEERGLAFMQSIKLVSKDWLGHGFGFVEHYFAHSAVSVKGLGEGTSAVFCAPLDLVLIAGPIGLLAWAVFFGGLGLGRRAMSMMAPIAAWSLINPMHQGESSYLFLGFLVAFAARPGVGAWRHSSYLRIQSR